MSEVTLKKIASAMSSAKASPANVLMTYREILCSKIPEATQIYNDLDSKILFPTNALTMIRPLVFKAMQVDAKEETKAKEEKAAVKAESNKKKYVATIFDSNGQPVKYWTMKNGERVLLEMTSTFELPQQAERWIARRLTTGAGEATALDCECFGEYHSDKQLDSEGLAVVTTINMRRAWGLMNPTMPKAACFVKKPSGNPGNNMRCNNFVAKFSGCLESND